MCLPAKLVASVVVSNEKEKKNASLPGSTGVEMADEGRHLPEDTHIRGIYILVDVQVNYAGVRRNGQQSVVHFCLSYK